MEVYENFKIKSKGSIVGDTLRIDLDSKKITVDVMDDKYRDRIYKIIDTIVNKPYDKDVKGYKTEFINPNGLVNMTIIFNSFYQFIIMASPNDYKNSTGNYLKYYYK